MCGSWAIKMRNFVSYSLSMSRSGVGVLGVVVVSIMFLGEFVTVKCSNTGSSDAALDLDSPNLPPSPKPHSCYVCLPPDKESNEALEILRLFPPKERGRIRGCDEFDEKNKKDGRSQFEFQCPLGYGGCLIRVHGVNTSRSCTPLPFNECKIANSKELCFCKDPLCNGGLKGGGDLKSPVQPSPKMLELETDDEDLIELADETSSGDGPYPDVGGGLGGGGYPHPYPPGVVDHYTTTRKPTLVPNIRGEKKTTTPPPTSGGSYLKPLFTTAFLIILSVLLVS